MARKINPITFRLGISNIWKYSNSISLKNYTNSFLSNYIITLYLPKILKSFYLILTKISIYKKRFFGKIYLYILYIHFKNTRYKSRLTSYFLKNWLKKNLNLLQSFNNFCFFNLNDFLNFYFTNYLTKIWLPYCKIFFIEPYEQKISSENLFYLWYQFNGIFFVLPYGRFSNKDFYIYNLSKLFDFIIDFPKINICEQLLKYIALILEKDRRHWPLINQLKAIFKRGFVNFKKFNFKIFNIYLRISGKIKGARRSRKILITSTPNKIKFQKLNINLFGSYFFANTKYGTIGLHLYIYFKNFKIKRSLLKLNIQQIIKTKIKQNYIQQNKHQLLYNEPSVLIKYNLKNLNLKLQTSNLGNIVSYTNKTQINTFYLNNLLQLNLQNKINFFNTFSKQKNKTFELNQIFYKQLNSKVNNKINLLKQLQQKNMNNNLSINLPANYFGNV